jgi:hypothetical protein
VFVPSGQVSFSGPLSVEYMTMVLSAIPARELGEQLADPLVVSDHPTAGVVLPLLPRFLSARWVLKCGGRILHAHVADLMRKRRRSLETVSIGHYRRCRRPGQASGASRPSTPQRRRESSSTTTSSRMSFSSSSVITSATQMTATAASCRLEHP